EREEEEGAIAAPSPFFLPYYYRRPPSPLLLSYRSSRTSPLPSPSAASSSVGHLYSSPPYCCHRHHIPISPAAAAVSNVNAPQRPPTGHHCPSPSSPRKPSPPLLPALIAAFLVTAASTYCHSPPTRPCCSGHLPQQLHITVAFSSSTTAAATPSSAAAPPAHNPLLSSLLLPSANVVASLALSRNHRWALLTLTPQPPPSPVAAALIGLPLSSPSSLASSPDPAVVALARPPLPPSLPLPLLPSSPQPRHRHLFFLPIVQPKAKAATILPCCHSRLQPRPPHLLPSAATSIAALPNCR
ncbi:hypothetical protein GW17_00058978, partial [Ensete ventricosum]